MSALRRRAPTITSNPFGDQAEWAQGYDNDARFAVTRSTTPVLSQATFDATEHAIDQYRQIVQRGGWSKVPTGRTLRLGSSGAAVVALRKRLIVSGDLDAASGASPIFDSYVDAGAKHFQARHGFIENGVVGPDVLAAMNMPADMRLHQLEINLVRLKAFSGNLGGRYVMANIPAESVETVENGVVATHHRAGVGRIDRQSPVMQTRALDINFNPYWHVPESLIHKDLIPKMLADSNYLTEHHIHIMDKNGQEVPPSSVNWHTNQAFQYSYREDPGTENSLGVVRININNPYGVYMHDTSEKGVFGDDNRFVSSGCIRVQNVRDYVQWLLKDTPAGTARRSTRRSAPVSRSPSSSPTRCRSTGSTSPPGPTRAASSSSATTSISATASARPSPARSAGPSRRTACPRRASTRAIPASTRRRTTAERDGLSNLRAPRFGGAFSF